jgi:hypothetical protein
MTNPNHRSMTTSDNSGTNKANEDTTSVTTEQTGTKATPNDQGMKEITIKFEFQPPNANESQKVSLVHTHILMEIQKEFEDAVQIYDNKNKQLKSIDPIVWNSVTHHQRHFKTHSRPGSQNRRSKLVIIHRFHTDLSLSTIKHHGTINNLLKQNHCYMRAHAFDETIWDTMQLGYFIGINPQHYTEDQTASIIKDDFKKKGIKSHPSFRMVYSSPNLQYKGSNGRTKAYAIEFDRKDATAMSSALKTTYASTNKFLLARLRYTHPESFRNAIRIQNSHLSSVYVIPLDYCNPDLMFYIKDPLLARTGVLDVVQVQRRTKEGRYNVLVEKLQFNSVKRWLDQHLDQLVSTAPPDALVPNQFPDIPQLAMGSGGDNSSGELSFMSMSAVSFASVDTTGIPDTFEFHPIRASTSWSGVVQNVPRARTDDSTINTATTVSEITPNQEIDALKAQLAELQEAAHQREIKDSARIDKLMEVMETQAKWIEKVWIKMEMESPATSPKRYQDTPMNEPSTQEPDAKRSDSKMTPERLHFPIHQHPSEDLDRDTDFP